MENSNKYYNNYERRLLQNVFRALCKVHFPFVPPINADQTLFFFPEPFLHNAADSIHVPLNDAFMYSPINK